MDFFLFLLVNFTLFLRPAEIVPALEALPIYNYTILAAFALGLPKVAKHLKPEAIANEPITFCVLGLLVAVVMSHLAHFDMWSARNYGFEFLKVVIYYLLLISVVDSTSRLRRFLYAVAILAAVSASVAILHFYDYITVPSLKVLEYFEEINPETGEPIMIRRLQATGIFSDPNDLSMIAVLGAIISTCGLGDLRLGPARLAWLIPLGVLLTTVALTKSRGGILALGVAIAMLSYLRYGLWKTMIPIVLFLPIAWMLLAGRGNAMESGSGTAAERVELWSEGLLMIKQFPIFGIGIHNFADEAGLVAHNSFVHCFAELGFFGGGLFLGAFWFSGLILWKLGSSHWLIFQQSTELSFRQMRPYLLAMLAAYCTSMLSLSRSYVVTTYLVLGLANTYCLEAQRQGIPPVVRLSPGRLVALLPLSFALLIATYVFIKLSVR